MGRGWHGGGLSEDVSTWAKELVPGLSEQQDRLGALKHQALKARVNEVYKPIQQSVVFMSQRAAEPAQYSRKNICLNREEEWKVLRACVNSTEVEAMGVRTECTIGMDKKKL